MGKNYTLVGEGWKCEHCGQMFETRQQVYIHWKEHKENNNQLTPFDKHFNGTCGKSSRKCRYCHSEVEISKRDVLNSRNTSLKGLSFEKQIELLLTNESRYRHKFTKLHITWLLGKSTKQLKNMIHSRVMRRVRVKPTNDGKQTPYIANAIDTASHSMAICCRGCISRWHSFDRDAELTEDQVNYLVSLVLKYLEIIKTNKTLREWMTELPLQRYYEPGKYELKCLKPKKVGEKEPKGKNWKEFTQGKKDIHAFVTEKW